MSDAKHLCTDELEAGLDDIRQSPKGDGVVHMIVRRPKTDEREVLAQGRLDTTEGLIGDNWRIRGSARTNDGFGHPEMQINIMNSRVVALVAGKRERWPLAGDQIYVDLDLSKENLPAGTQLQLGTAILEVSSFPHTGCKKFVARFGLDATTFVNSGLGKKLCLRGINAKVVKSGTFNVSDIVHKMS